MRVIKGETTTSQSGFVTLLCADMTYISLLRWLLLLESVCLRRQKVTERMSPGPAAAAGCLSNTGTACWPPVNRLAPNKLIGGKKSKGLFAETFSDGFSQIHAQC